jgi:hypothetical protein
MFALPIALLLALPAGEVQPAGPAAAVDPAFVATTLIPSGTATGCWVGATMYDEGVLVALMEDEIGRPLFVMDAKITPNGLVYGKLRPLEYATNPGLGMPQLYVAGEAQIHPTETGSFWAVISAPIDGGLLPVKPFGRIEGVLIHGLERLAKPGIGQASPHLKPSPSSVHQPSGVLGIGSVSAQSQVTLAGAHQPTGVFGVQPQGAQQPGYQFASAHQASGVLGIQSVSAQASGTSGGQPVGVGIAAAEPSLHCIVCPKGTDLAVYSVSRAGPAVPEEPQGQVTPIFCPYLAPSIASATQAGPAAAIGELPTGSSFQAAKVEVGVQPIQPSQPVPGEGRVRATWYLLP